jgi:hypothetical protein
MMANPDMLNLHFEDITKSELKASTIALEKHRAKVTSFGFSLKNKLQLSQQQIVTAVKVAFENGRFKHAHTSSF